MDNLIRLILQADPSQAIGGVKRLSDELRKQQEELKRATEAERQRSAQARVGIAEQVLAEKRRQLELKNTQANVIGVARAQENLRAAQNRASLAAQNAALKQKEFAEAGATGLARYEGLLSLIPGRFGAMASGGVSSIGQISSAFGAAGVTVSALTLGIGVGLVGAIAAAAKGASYLSEELQKASQAQLTQIGASSEIQRVYGTDQRSADRFYSALQARIEIAGRNTSVSSSDIQGYSDIALPQFLAAFKGAGRSLEDTAKNITNVSTRFAIAAQSTPGVTEFQVKSALTSAVSGDLANAITKQEFFRNSGLGTIIQQVATEQGVSLANATAAQQIDILEQALQRKIPDSLINRAQGVVTSQISAFTDSLFSPLTGAFGVRRNLERDAAGVLREGTSVFDAFAESVTLLIGRDGTLAQIGESLDKLLPDYDVMADIRGGFQSLNTGLRSLNEFLDSFNKLLDDIANSPLGRLVSAIDSKLPKPGDTLASAQLLNKNQDGSTTIGGTVDLKQAPVVGGFFSGMAGFFSNLFGAPRFAGTYPGVGDAAPSMPILSAIAVENANKPPGSELVIANSSETILTREQMQTIAAGSGRGGRSLNVENLNIYPAAGSDARSMALQVIEEIDFLLNAEQNARLT